MAIPFANEAAMLAWLNTPGKYDAWIAGLPAANAALAGQSASQMTAENAQVAAYAQNASGGGL